MAQHPLEPLSADEFRQTASILRREGLVRDTFRFASIELKEPPKSEVKVWRPGDAVRRASFAVVFNREDNKTYEATVDLTGHAVVSFDYVPDVTPNFTLDEFHDVDVAMRQHPDVIAKLAARGFTDMSLILVDVWRSWRPSRLRSIAASASGVATNSTFCPCSLRSRPVYLRKQSTA
jgi:primary-amine oxidase